MENKDIFFYWIHYPSTEPHDCWWENDIEHISRTRKNVEDAWKRQEMEDEEELSVRDNRIDEFKSDIAITGPKVWIIFNYDAEDPDWARICFLGNSREDCLKWLSENAEDFGIYDLNKYLLDSKKSRSWGTRGYGLVMKEMEIA